eukprot:2651643-Prymnesium_polylepis.1
MSRSPQPGASLPGSMLSSSRSRALPAISVSPSSESLGAAAPPSDATEPASLRESSLPPASVTTPSWLSYDSCSGCSGEPPASADTSPSPAAS